MKRMLFSAAALIAFSSPVYASTFCKGFEEGYKSFQPGLSIVPLCPLEPLTPLGSDSYREGIKAGVDQARKNTSINHSTAPRGPLNYNIDVESPIQKLLNQRQRNEKFELEQRRLDLEERRLKIEEERLEQQQSDNLPKGFTVVSDPTPLVEPTLSENEILLPNGQILVLDPDTLIYSLR